MSIRAMVRCLGALAASLAMMATFASAASAQPVTPSTAASSPPGTSSPQQAAGTFCVDYLSKAVGPDGNSVTVAHACSSQSIEIARTQARAAAVRKSVQTGASVTPLASTLLIRLYINYNQDSLQREIYGTSGPCDGAGYTFAAFTNDYGRMSSSQGYNGCNAVRLRNLQGQFSYLFEPANWVSGWNDNTNQYHPYCANPSTGLAR